MEACLHYLLNRTAGETKSRASVAQFIENP